MKTFTWCVSIDSSETTTQTVNRVQFGDGYEQVSSFGINNTRKAWSCSKIAKKAEIDAIYQFLISTQSVEPFYFQPAATAPNLIVRLDGDVSRSTLGAGVWQISFNLRQAFI